MKMEKGTFLTNFSNKLKSLLSLVRERKKFSLFVVVMGAGLGLVPLMALGGNQLIQAVDSNSFCISCHNVHDPEAVTYELSPHSQINCATCHVGEGVDNLVMSKLNGLKDIPPTFTGKYPHPIPTPLQDRRPSSETCETCHWAEKFFGDVPRIKTTYATDKTNTANTTTLVLKVDGGKAKVATGIHWHSTAKVWYLPLDDKRLQIAWVATENATGGVNEYVDPNRIEGVTPELIQQQKRLMDCIDCHNRVTHLFSPPGDLVDKALTEGSIDISLPYIKAKAIEALVPQNTSLDQAYLKIAAIKDFYASSYPGIFQSKQTSIDSAVTKLEEIARLTTFPDGLDWNTHLNQAVHDKPDANMQIDWSVLALKDDSAGCFRCHGNLVKASDPANPNLEEALKGTNLKALKVAAEATLAASANSTSLAISSVNSTSSTGGAVNSTNGTGILLSALNAVSANASLTSSSGNNTSLISNRTGDNRTVSRETNFTDTAAYDGRLNDNCNLCHTTSMGSFISPLAPATPHPIDGLDDCLVCHSPSAAQPFKTDHPWSTNEACNTCHKSAPKLSSLPVSGPPDEEAKPTPHDVKGLEDCLVCHNPKGTNPIKDKHPWVTNDTCNACHQTATKLQPIPLSTPPVAPDTVHPVQGFEDCLSCHGQPALIPFTTKHPWSTNGTCSTCHKPSTTLIQATHTSAFIPGPDIKHPTSGVGECVTCHIPIATHPWADTQSCTKCHQLSAYVVGPKITHSLGGLGECLACHASTASHPWSTTSLCTQCHKLNSSTGGGGGGGSGGGGAFVNPAPQLTMGPNVLHSITGLDNCTACHNSAGNMLFPASHIGRPNSMCLICHQVAPPATVPASPSALAAVAADAGRVNLTWLDNSTTETGFRLQRATSNDFSVNLLTTALAANTVSYSDTTTSGSTTYYYRVCAYNTAGDSAASDAPLVTTPVSTATIPAAPTVLVANAISATQVNLSWLDNATAETGFRIDRATNNAFTSNLVTVNTVVNAISYSDTTVSSSTTYYYRVYAFNSAGNSPASNLASANTPGVTIDPAALYSANCAICHGATRQGGSASSLTTSDLSSVTLAQVTSTINSGVGTMPAYSSSLSSAQVSALAEWLKGPPPAAPASLSASAINAGRINLFWLDSSADETGFRIQRATSSDFLTNSFTATVSSNKVTYSDTTTAGSTTYYYRVFAYNASGDSTASNTASTTTPASTVSPPAAPTVLVATAVSATQVNLAWLDNSTTETGFRIDRAITSDFTTNRVTVTVAVDAVSYSDTTVSANTTYYYRVYAFNSAGNSAAASNTATVTTPVLSSAEIYSTNCAVCHGATRQGGSASALTTSALSGVTLAQVTTTIANGIGTMPDYSSSLSSTQIADLALWLKGPPPSPPTSLAATAVSAGQVNLAWLDNSTDETGFRIERATTSNFLTNLVATALAANTVSYADTTTAGSTTYYYRVYAYNSTGDSAASNTPNVTTPAPTVTAPAAPTGLTATAISANQVNLAWLDNSTTETGFRIDRATTSNFLTNLVTVNTAANAINYNDNSCADSINYYYRVYSFNSAGNSAAASNTANLTTPALSSAELYSANCAICHGATRQGGSASALTTSALSGVTLAQVITTIANGIGTMPAYSSSLSSTQIADLALWLKGPPPSAPTSLTASAISAGRVNLTWLDNSTNETGFRLERATTSNFLTNLVATALAANTASYADTTTAGSTTYYYRVYAYNLTGDSAASNMANATTPAPTVTAPAAPTGLTATAVSANQVNLAWVDNANNETGLRVERATDSGFTANKITATVAANAVSYNDTTTAGSTTYYYRVFAYNSAGDSAASNTRSVTTPAAPIDPAALYSANCAVCHGANRQGGSASALTTSALSGVTLAQVTSTITNGIGTMPAYSSSLSSAQIAALAQWLKGPPPSAPTSLTASAISAGRVNLTWLDNSTDETGFRLERATTSNFLTNLVATALAANTASYADTTTAGSTTYYYRVFAYNASGDSTASNTASATTPAPTVTAPTAPTSLTASAVSAIQVNLAWIDNSTTETGFRIDRATTSNFLTNLMTVNTAANAVSYSDTTVAGLTTYYYRVYSFNSAGNSAAASNTASITTPAPSPAQIYSASCATCHGASGQGASAPAVAGAAAPTTSFIVRGGGVTMPAYTTAQISASDLTSLATYVKGLGPVPTTGTALYSLDCAVCHGATGQGTTIGSYLAGVPTNITSSITRSGLGTIMPAYNTTEISASSLTTLANYILALGPAPSDGWGVYAEYCAVCHGTGGEGGSGGSVRGASVSTTSSAVRSGPDSMPAYTTAQISDTALSNLATYVRNLSLARPTGLTATTVSSSRVNLSWTNSAASATGMRLQRATNSSFSTNLVTFNLGVVTSYSDTLVSGATVYYYRVYATTLVGASSASTTATVTTP